MGIFDYFNGRAEKQRVRRAEKVRIKFGSHPGLTQPMLDALANANTMPDKDDVELYLLAVPEGAEPTRVSIHFIFSATRTEIAVLFPDGLSLLSREAGKDKNKQKFPPIGGQLPFWGIQNIEVVKMNSGDAALVVTGSDGKTPYRFSYSNTDHEEIKSLARDINEARALDAQRRSARAVAQSPTVSIDSSLPKEEQLKALRQMREMTGMPDDAYYAMVRSVEEGASKE